MNSPDDRPSAPAPSASSSSSVIRASSCGSGGRSSIPIVISRSVLCPTSITRLTESRGIGAHVIGEACLHKIEPRCARAQILLERVGLAGERRGAGIAAMADDLGRHPLTHLALRQRHQRQRPVGMGLDVDEAGRDDPARGVHDRCPAGGKIVADRPDAAVLDDDIGGITGRTAAVDHGAAADDDGLSHRRGASAALRCRRKASAGPRRRGRDPRPTGRSRAPVRTGSRSRTPRGRSRRIRARI